ncbi:hypothetical protein AXW67_10340 [Bradyrhizobium neotropicale]|uniref:Uncharacterized protein n=1 Tax=Bradyrhizobium neotropicale TaxID=1497615 RepID=A0A176ZAJ2_9BRAD|nr:hypothetical protein AXW67_10340 [Bradyrhizobium neotropicale]
MVGTFSALPAGWHHREGRTVWHERKSEPKHLVICSDGTGNEISQTISNAPKLHRRLRTTNLTRPRAR